MPQLYDNIPVSRPPRRRVRGMGTSTPYVGTPVGPLGMVAPEPDPGDGGLLGLLHDAFVEPAMAGWRWSERFGQGMLNAGTSLWQMATDPANILPADVGIEDVALPALKEWGGRWLNPIKYFVDNPFDFALDVGGAAATAAILPQRVAQASNLVRGGYLLLDDLARAGAPSGHTVDLVGKALDRTGRVVGDIPPRHIRWVRTDELAAAVGPRRFERTSSAVPGSSMQDYANELRAGGNYRKPVEVLIDPDTGLPEISDGNHTFTAAEMAGREYVPVWTVEPPDTRLPLQVRANMGNTYTPRNIPGVNEYEGNLLRRLLFEERGGLDDDFARINTPFRHVQESPAEASFAQRFDEAVRNLPEEIVNESQYRALPDEPTPFTKKLPAQEKRGVWEADAAWEDYLRTEAAEAAAALGLTPEELRVQLLGTELQLPGHPKFWRENLPDPLHGQFQEQTLPRRLADRLEEADRAQQEIRELMAGPESGPARPMPEIRAWDESYGGYPNVAGIPEARSIGPLESAAMREARAILPQVPDEDLVSAVSLVRRNPEAVDPLTARLVEEEFARRAYQSKYGDDLLPDPLPTNPSAQQVGDTPYFSRNVERALSEEEGRIPREELVQLEGERMRAASAEKLETEPLYQRELEADYLAPHIQGETKLVHRETTVPTEFRKDELAGLQYPGEVGQGDVGVSYKAFGEPLSPDEVALLGRAERVVVAGSRDLDIADILGPDLAALSPRATVVHGAARGVDSTFGGAAAASGRTVEAVPANWTKFGKSAGYRRNREMIASQPDVVLAYWDGKSKGTLNTIEEAQKAGIPVIVRDTRLARKETPGRLLMPEEAASYEEWSDSLQYAPRYERAGNPPHTHTDVELNEFDNIPSHLALHNIFNPEGGHLGQAHGLTDELAYRLVGPTHPGDLPTDDAVGIFLDWHAEQHGLTGDAVIYDAMRRQGSSGNPWVGNYFDNELTTLTTYQGGKPWPPSQAAGITSRLSEAEEAAIQQSFAQRLEDAIAAPSAARTTAVRATGGMTNHLRNNPDAVYVGRPGRGQQGPFGNPFRVGRDGPDEAAVVEKYRVWLEQKVAQDPAFAAKVKALAGKELVCFPHPGPCHAEVLAEMANRLNGISPQQV